MSNGERPLSGPYYLLDYSEAERVANDIRRIWPGLIPECAVPQLEVVTDLVQRIQREAEAIIQSRED